MAKGLGFGLGKPKKSSKVKDESRFRESEPEQTECKVERTGEMSETRVFAGRAWNDRESNDFRDGAGGPEFWDATGDRKQSCQSWSGVD
ncbi:hypothetical protein SCLCIDRAFT_28058 [Scleroderma citrinum Foug A]|uniref:Uncharacterized protein n=1 Tax=Scleroderma citrinum Foug A TaxID=1036808 RepID=A0A0C3DQD3_9AGAM|nr:hypothetical protein SCLCIDRAFT_28058 [Scleroderma citrinum Foug A]